MPRPTPGDTLKNSLVSSMKRDRFGAVLLLAVRAFAQPSNVNVVAVTPQQALIQYNSPDALPCTLSATSGGVLQETVWDLSEAEFPGSSSDLARANTILSTNSQRQVEI